MTQINIRSQAILINGEIELQRYTPVSTLCLRDLCHLRVNSPSPFACAKAVLLEWRLHWTREMPRSYEMQVSFNPRSSTAVTHSPLAPLFRREGRRCNDFHRPLLFAKRRGLGDEFAWRVVTA